MSRLFDKSDDIDVEEDFHDADLDEVQESIFRYPRLKIALFCCVLSVVAWAAPDKVAQYLVFSFDNFFVKHYYWTIITSQFVHSGLLHLIGNMIFLFVFGGVVTKYANDRFMFVTFLIGGAAGFFVCGWWYGSSASVVGASAGIMALAALAMLAHPTTWSWFIMMPIGLFAFLYLLYNIAVAYIGSGSGIAYIGHLAGFGTGIAEGIIWMPHWQRNLKITLVMFGIFVVGLFLLGFLYIKYIGGISLI